MAEARAGNFPQQNYTNHEDQLTEKSHWAYVKLHGTGSPRWTANKGNKNLREILCSHGMRKPAPTPKGGAGPHCGCSQCTEDLSCGGFYLGSKPLSCPVDSPPSRYSGGTGQCTCSRPPTERSACSSSRPVESCLPGLHQQYRDFYPDCEESHLPSGYRRFVEHDDLYLPASRPLSPASTDHDDLYLPLTRPCSPPSPRPAAQADWYVPAGPRPCAPPSPQICTCTTSAAYDGDVYLPESSPCTPGFREEEILFLPPPLKRPAPAPRECFGLGGMATERDNMPAPCFKPTKVVCLECSPSRSPSPTRSPSPSSCPSPTSTVYIAEIPPCAGNRATPCSGCSCHKADSGRKVCPPPKPPARCDPKPRLKLQSIPGQCKECNSPSVCKGPAYCNPQYIVETPLSISPPRSRTPSPRPESPSSCSDVGNMLSPRCRTCDCHKEGGSNSCKQSSPCPPPMPDPCCTAPPSPCAPRRFPFAAELLSGEEDCYYHAMPGPPKCAADSPKPSPKCDPRCASCDCHKSKLACRPPSPPPCACPPPSCPIPTCSSKSPISDSRTPKTSSGAFRGGQELHYPRSKSSSSPVSSRGYTSPGKVSPNPKSPSSKSKLQQLEEPKVRYPSPRTQMESFNSYLKSQSLRHSLALSPERRCSQRQSPSRRSQASDRRFQQPHQARSAQTSRGTHPILLPVKPSDAKHCAAQTPNSSSFHHSALLRQQEKQRSKSSGAHRSCCCRRIHCGETGCPMR